MRSAKQSIQEETLRPWGVYTVLDQGDGFKVKRVVVKPGQRLSYQKHERRSEHWVIVSGVALVTIDEREWKLQPGHSIDVPLGSRHRIRNDGDEELLFIEVQRGAYLEEDDIIRFDDDYGRVAEATDVAPSLTDA